MVTSHTYNFHIHLEYFVVILGLCCYFRPFSFNFLNSLKNQIFQSNHSTINELKSFTNLHGTHGELNNNNSSNSKYIVHCFNASLSLPALHNKLSLPALHNKITKFSSQFLLETHKWYRRCLWLPCGLSYLSFGWFVPWINFAKTDWFKRFTRVTRITLESVHLLKVYQKFEK